MRHPCTTDTRDRNGHDHAVVRLRGFGVLHEDRHFDTLAGVLGFPSVRLNA
jgi:hypothetical protein